jgi:cytochrome c551/c552
MAIITGTATTFSGSPGMQGLREDLSDMIYLLSPSDTPFTSNVGRGTADAVLHEWQTDSLAAANVNNAQFQGDDIATFSAASVTARLGNRTQISRKEVIISGTLDAVNKAGRRTELAYQLTKRAKELKIDIESILLANQAKVTGAAATAPKCASVLSWLKTNIDAVGAGPTVGDGTEVRTDGGQRAFTEAQLKNVMKQVYTNSSEDLDVVMVGASNKQVASTFTGNATKMVDVMEKQLVATVDVYVGDFHTVRVIPNRFMRTRDALVLNWSYWSVDWLRPIRQVELAKTGDAEKRMLLGEYTLAAKNEASSGGVFDLTVP